MINIKSFNRLIPVSSNDGKILLYDGSNIGRSVSSLSEILRYAVSAYSDVGGFVIADDDGTGKPAVVNPNPNIIYLVKNSSTQDPVLYTAWIYTTEWSCIDSTDIPLDDYLTKAEASATYQTTGDYATINDVSSMIASSVSAEEWNATYSDVTENSATWNTVTDKLDASAFETVSGDFLTNDDISAAEWNAAHDAILENSATWNTVTNKLDASAFETASGNFLTNDDISATEWNEAYNLLSANSATLTNPLELSEGANISIASAGNKVTIAASGVMQENALDTISGAWNEVSAKLDTSAFETLSGDFLTNDDISATEWNEAYNLLSANSAALTNPLELVAGNNINIESANNSVIVSTSGVVTSASDLLADKLLVLHNNTWRELPEAGGFITAASTAADLHPDEQNPSTKLIYLVKDPNATGKVDQYKEWIFISATMQTPSSWECIGDTSLDLSDYATQAYVDTNFSGKDALATEFAKYVKSSDTTDWDKSAYSGSDTISINNHVVNLSNAYKTIVEEASGKLDDIFQLTEGNNISIISADNSLTIAASGVMQSTALDDVSATWNDAYNVISEHSATLVNPLELVEGNNISIASANNSVTISVSGVLLDNALDNISGSWNEVSAKLDTTAFSTVSGDFLTDTDISATEWNESYDIVAAHSATIINPLELSEGANISITNSDNTATISVSGVMLDNALDSISGTWNDVSAKLDTTAFSTVSGDFLTNADISATEWNEAYDIVAANSASIVNPLELVAGNNISIASAGNNVTIAASGLVTSANQSLDNKLLVLNNNAWTELPEFGNFKVASADAQGYPDEQNPSTKTIYLVKDTTVTGVDQYKEWLFTSADAQTTAWECIGDTSLDLSDYITTTVLNTALADYQTTANMSAYYLKTETSGAAEISAALELKEDKVFIAEYNVTPYADIKDAYDDGKQIFLLAKNFNENTPAGWSPFTFKVPLTDFYSLGNDAWFKFSFFNDGRPTKQISVTIRDNNVWSVYYVTLQDTLTAGTDLVINNGVISVNTNGSAIGDFAFVEGQSTSAVGDYSHAGGMSSVAEGFASFAYGSSTHASGDGAVAIGISSVAYGQAAYAEGEKTSAVYNNTHAEGWYTIASGWCAHAEGQQTSAMGEDTHSEGQGTVALGNGAHAEGMWTTAVGSFGSHAEGENTITVGMAAHAEGYYTSAIGDFSHTEGNNTYTTAPGAHAEGLSTTAVARAAHTEGSATLATSDAAHAEGQNTLAVAQAAHAEGQNTQSIGQASHAEGYSARAFGANSHAEGQETTAYGIATHAEGISTSAVGDYSHAEGHYTSAVEYGSHAEGNNTFASGYGAHAEGSYTTAAGIYAHAEGDNTVAVNNDAHAEGAYSKATGKYSHAEGNFTQAYGESTHAEGCYTNATGYYSHTEGYYTTAVGECSHAEGTSTLTVGSNSHAEGDTTQAIGTESHTEGWSTKALGSKSHAEGCAATANGNASHAEGSYTNAVGNNSHAEGWGSSAFGTYSHAEGFEAKTDDQYTHAEGLSTSALIYASHAEGCSTLASAYQAHAEGYGTSAIGANSHAEGNSTLASSYSHAEGSYTSAVGQDSHAEGYTTKATGEYSHAEGGYTNAEGRYAHAGGYNTSAIGDYSNAIGYNTIAAASAMTVIGQYNLTDSALFVIGNGLDDANRSDVFIVYPNGSVSAAGKISANGVELGAGGCSSLTAGTDLAINNGIISVNTNGTVGNSAEMCFVAGSGTYASGIGAAAFGYNANALGNYSFAEGYYTSAVNNYSHAEGGGTLASGQDCHAEGGGTKALGDGSHAEGTTTLAKAYASHAEGYQTSAVGNVSHAEGASTSAVGSNSHAECAGTSAIGSNSHAEGGGTKASGDQSHAEGGGTQAIGGNSHAEGGTTSAIGGNSHAEGGSTSAVGPQSHAEGNSTSAVGTASHAEGVNTFAAEDNSHAEGASTKAIGWGAHAEGNTTQAIGTESHAEGGNTQAIGIRSHAEGQSTKAEGDCSHAEGDVTNAIGDGSHAEGWMTTANGHYSHAEGLFTSALHEGAHAEGHTTSAVGTYSHAEGLTTSAVGNYSHAEGKYTIASDEAMHVGGKYNKTSANALFVIGNGTNNNRSDAFIVQNNGIASATNFATSSIPDINAAINTQADWAETATSSLAYINNKPDVLVPVDSPAAYGGISAPTAIMIVTAMPPAAQIDDNTIYLVQGTYIGT